MMPQDAPPAADADPDLPAATPWRRWKGLALFMVGLALLAAAVVVALRRGELVLALDSLRRAPWTVIAGVLLLPPVNWLLTSGVFAVLTRRFGRVGWGEMSALIASAWLLNLLPMRPGMLGRVAYHKRYNAVRVRDSALVLFLAMACTAAAALLLVGAMYVVRWLVPAAAGSRAMALAGGAPLAGLALIASALRALRPHSPLAWRVVAACTFRYADVLVWTIRYVLVFDLAGSPIDLVQAAVIAAASQAAMAVPIQVGVREWIVGVVGAAITAGGVSHLLGGPGAIGAAAPGVAADLLNRGAELAVVLPLGLGSTLWLWGRRSTRAARAAGDAGRL